MQLDSLPQTRDEIQSLKIGIAQDFIVATATQQRVAREITDQAFRAAPGAWFPSDSAVRRWRRGPFTFVVGLFGFAGLAASSRNSELQALLMVSWLVLAAASLFYIVPIVLMLRIRPDTHGKPSFHVLDETENVVLFMSLKRSEVGFIGVAFGLWSRQRGRTKLPPQDAAKAGQPPESDSTVLMRTLIRDARLDGRLSSLHAHSKNWSLYDRLYEPVGFVADETTRMFRVMHIPMTVRLCAPDGALHEAANHDT